MTWKICNLLLIFFFTVGNAEKAMFLKDVGALIEKYSNLTADHLSKTQLQDLLDNLQKCSEYANETVTSTPKGCTISGGCNETNECLSAGYIFNLLDITNDKFDSNSLTAVCPLILRHLESHACGSIKNEASTESLELKKPSSYEVWGLGFLFVTVISLCSLLGVTFLPLMDKDFYQQLLMVLIGLAVGSLSASSVFHLIPQAFQLIDEDNQHEYLNISIMLWAGIWVFFLTERIMKIISNAKDNQHLHSELPCKDISADIVSAVSSPTELIPNHDHDDSQVDRCMLSKYNYQDQVMRTYTNHEISHDTHSHSHHIHFEQGKDSVVATVAWMIIFGDGLHNFIDGLSIGAAFNESILTGISISMAVMCEELPHELGDFAVLLNAGMTMKQALVYNFLSACTCYLGLILGILLGEFEASHYIFGFAAGMFMYISLVDMMPELNRAAEDASKISVKTAVKTLALQNIGLLIGVAVLFFLARFQDSITFM
ncbi:Putative zinc transporter [Gryllus bimaculatus]|nr:Putative zinc transporter [Gryllus bimaculatus]